MCHCHHHRHGDSRGGCGGSGELLVWVSDGGVVVMLTVVPVVTVGIGLIGLIN